MTYNFQKILQKKSSVGFMFAGQGTFYPGFGKQYYSLLPFRQALQEVSDELHLSIPDHAWGKRAFITAKRNELLQVTLFTLYIGLSKILQQQIGAPTIVMGHSLGEICALVISGAVSLKDACHFVYKRGKYMDEASQNCPQDMLAIFTDQHDFISKLASDKVSISNINSPNQIVLSGKLSDLKPIRKILRSNHKIRSVFLGTKIACHSKLLNNQDKKLREVIQGLPITKTQSPFFSVCAQSVINNPIDIRKHLSDHMIATVNWMKAIKTIYNYIPINFIEISSGTTLKALGRQIEPRLQIHSFNQTYRKELSIC